MQSGEYRDPRDGFFLSNPQPHDILFQLIHAYEQNITPIIVNLKIFKVKKSLLKV